jgi:NAD(P)H-dependent FMN reductase
MRGFKGLPVGLMGATPGNFGTAFSQYAWLPTLRVLGTQVWSGGLVWISGAMGKFDDDGSIKRVTAYMRGFAEFVRQVKR